MFRTSVHSRMHPKLDFQQTKVQRMPRGSVPLCINADRCSPAMPVVSTLHSISLLQFCSLQHLAGYSHSGWSPVMIAGHCSGFAGFLHASMSCVSKILFEIIFSWLHLSLMRGQHIPQCDKDSSLHFHEHLLWSGTCIFHRTTLTGGRQKLGMSLLRLQLDRCFLALSNYRNKLQRIIRECATYFKVD